ncbi:MAG: UbiA-like polyprenyltransferase [Armatimonadaceae bacterium]|jgi:4-hydroxybenzoate polyprenyltransferase
MTLAASSWHRLRTVLEMIKFEHTLFALPFAATGMLLAADGFPSIRICFGILLAMVGARSAAMAFNRLVDRDIDAANPRTAGRALPAGHLDIVFVKWFVLVSCLVFVGAAASLNKLALMLSPIALLVVFGYSYTKRFTAWCHAWLGVALSIAPMGAWVAVRGRLDWEPVWLCAAVVAWLIGFDVIYALQDEEFDRSRGLHSLPARFGARKALWISRTAHAAMVLALFGLGVAAHLGTAYAVGLAIVIVTLIWEHSQVRENDLARVNIAFFHANVLISTVLMLAVGVDIAAAGGATR